MPCDNDCGCASTQETSVPEDSPRNVGGGWVSVYAIPKMDCMAEERMIRLALNSVSGIHRLNFDLQRRQLQVVHEGVADAITEQLVPLGLGAKHQSTLAAEPQVSLPPDTDAQETRVLRLLLCINAAMFVVELVAGWLAQSTGLMGDALDMLADAAVYGVALYAVGRSVSLQVRAAHLAGILQLLLAMGLLAEVARRWVSGSEPASIPMMVVSIVALLANVTCLMLIAKHRDAGAHMRASWIFSANDVLINAGVIVAGALVAWSGSNLPDLVIGASIGLIVLNGARRILAMKG